ncbi:MAG: alpha/beta fold hydrolase [Gammaproteobacteria bacterium]|nr:alpha/beta fold hydrolase [Gammaproteobacteria bacterium]MBU1416725.1 alpha/beta fold hydrolase [Gammaproteobacteria bacterium]
MIPIVLAGVFSAGLLGWFLRRMVHRSLAPERIPETVTPSDLGLEYRDVRIATENGKSLFGWFIPAANAGDTPAVVVLHGWGGNAEMMLPLARPLHEAGLSVLFFDVRCHGMSDEDSFVSLPRFAEDAEHAVDWLHGQAGVDPARIAVFGHSVGAGAALLLASRRPDIAAVVSLAAFAHPVTMMRRWLAARRVPYLPVGWLLMRYVELVIGHRFDDIAPLNTISKVRCPTLLIHGTADETVPLAEALAIHAARAGDHVEMKAIAGSHDDFHDLEQEVPVLVSFLSGAVDHPRSVGWGV